jgi:hypothetical protein
MKQQFIWFKRSGVFYVEDRATRKQKSLGTKSKAEALAFLNARNEAVRQPNLNLQLARAYLSASDPETATRTWQSVMDEMASHGKDATKLCCACAMRSKAFDGIRSTPLIQTKAEHFCAILDDCAVSVAHYLRRLHNLAYGLGWIPAPILPPKKWPKIQFGIKRGITAEEHARIIEAEKNVERRHYYQMLWETGAFFDAVPITRTLQLEINFAPRRLQGLRKLRYFLLDEMKRTSKADEIDLITKAIKQELVLDEMVLRRRRRALEKNLSTSFNAD